MLSQQTLVMMSIIFQGRKNNITAALPVIASASACLLIIPQLQSPTQWQNMYNWLVHVVMCVWCSQFVCTWYKKSDACTDKSTTHHSSCTVTTSMVDTTKRQLARRYAFICYSSPWYYVNIAFQILMYNLSKSHVCNAVRHPNSSPSEQLSS